VDATGVGVAVVDMMRVAGLRPIAVTITPGDRANHERWDAWWVPKKDIVGALQVAFQERRLKFATNLRDIPTIIRELQLFQVHITENAHATWSAREGEHDDLLLACGLAVYAANAGVNTWWISGSNSSVKSDPANDPIRKMWGAINNVPLGDLLDDD
jgi:hypothetical protein